MDEKPPPWIRYAPWRWPMEDQVALGLLALALVGLSWIAAVDFAPRPAVRSGARNKSVSVPAEFTTRDSNDIPTARLGKPPDEAAPKLSPEQ